MSKISRSVRLRKYEKIYKSFLRQEEYKYKSSMDKISRENLSQHQPTPQKSPKKSLNAYQKFIQTESRKSKYKNLPGNQRLSLIALEWKRKNRKK